MTSQNNRNSCGNSYLSASSNGVKTSAPVDLKQPVTLDVNTTAAASGESSSAAGAKSVQPDAGGEPSQGVATANVTEELQELEVKESSESETTSTATMSSSVEVKSSGAAKVEPELNVEGCEKFKNSDGETPMVGPSLINPSDSHIGGAVPHREEIKRAPIDIKPNGSEMKKVEAVEGAVAASSGGAVAASTASEGGKEVSGLKPSEVTENEGVLDVIKVEKPVEAPEKKVEDDADGSASKDVSGVFCEVVIWCFF